MTYSEALAWIYSTQHHGIKLGLDSIRRLLRELGYEGSHQRVIHVAGTNGKGSVCAMLDSICRAEGYRTALYTSPHLVEFRERIRINGAMISEEAVAGGLTTIREIVSEWDTSPTFFEIVTALALVHFQNQATEIVILETGLGGRLDATNAITPAVTVLTPIALDHQAYLGDSLAAIAREKAGIIKENVPVVSSPQPEEAAAVFRQTARLKKAPLQFVSSPLQEYEIGLLGHHQRENAALAVTALERSGIQFSEAAIRAGLRDVQWPGRFQRVQRAATTVILDGAHNKAAAIQLARTWKTVYGEEKATIILGVLRDKDLDAICEALTPIAARFIATPVRSDRSCRPEEILNAIRILNPEVEVDFSTDFPAALARVSNDSRVVVTGSLFLVGEALAFFEGNETVSSLQ